MNRDFSYKGVDFHLNDNWDGANREFEGKYILLYWNNLYGMWIQLLTINTKAEAKEAVREFYKAKCRCFAY